ncbi:MAG: DUF5522 domain-containing protein [Chitinophagales bacterium]|jgi:hypothetical protein
MSEENGKKRPNKQVEQSSPLIPGEDFYVENGRYVFTEHYHLKRGYCCSSGCRHCPFRNKKKPS